MTKQLTLFEDQRLTLERSLELTAEYLRSHFPRYSQVAIAFSGGKDSTALVTAVIHLIESGAIPRPERLTVIYADTRQELPPLHLSAMSILEEVKQRGFETAIAIAVMSKRFLPYILGRGVTPPSNTMRWCTEKIKVEPMMSALRKLSSSEKLLVLTGVRIGESAARDQRISVSCSKNGSECGQGWFQSATSPNADTLAPIIHWRVCHVWDWLMFEAPSNGWDTRLVAEAYGGDEAVEASARTGCMGCPLASDPNKALRQLLGIPQWEHLSPLLELHGIYQEMRSFQYRLQKDGTESRKDGNLVSNPGRKGPLTLAAREMFLERILDIQLRVNQGANQSQEFYLVNPEEEAFIRGCIADKVWPQRWTGDEPNGADLLPKFYSNGDVQKLLWSHN